MAEPDGYPEILSYLNRGPHPGFDRAQQIMDTYLEQVRFENCVMNPEVNRHIFRQLPFSIQAVDFDACPGAGISWNGRGRRGQAYREDTQMEIVELSPETEKEFAFDCGWDRFGLALEEGEFAGYSFHTGDLQGQILRLRISAVADMDSVIEVTYRDNRQSKIWGNKGREDTEWTAGQIDMNNCVESIRIQCLKGRIILDKLEFICN